MNWIGLANVFSSRRDCAARGGAGRIADGQLSTIIAWRSLLKPMAHYEP